MQFELKLFSKLAMEIIIKLDLINILTFQKTEMIRNINNC